MKDMSIPPGARAERLERNIISKEEAQSFINTEKQVENIFEDQDPDEDYDTGARIYETDDDDYETLQRNVRQYYQA